MSTRLIPLLILALAIVALRFSPVDVIVARAVFDPELNQPWKWAWRTPCHLLYHYGVWPAWLMAAAGGIMLGRACRRGTDGRLARAGLFLVLVTGLGPGLLVNLTLKPWYSRPRPRDLVEFGGQHEFVPVLASAPAAGCTSFPSGHAAMAFSLCAPAFLIAGRSRTASVLFAGVGLVLGTAVGTVRVLQGAHFVSDIVGSAGVVYVTALILWRVLKPDEPPVESGSVSQFAGSERAAA